MTAACALVMGLSACAHNPPPPGPGTLRGTPPDLSGQRVMLLPAQRVIGVGGDLDSELAFALQERGAGVSWVLPSELDEALERAPGLDTRTHNLPVDLFLAGEVQRIGDPLYGDLRRLGAVANAELAFLPVQAAFEPVADGGEGGAVRLWASLLDVRTGRVLWFAIVEGDPGPAGDPKPLASAVDELARKLLGPGSAG